MTTIVEKGIEEVLSGVGKVQLWESEYILSPKNPIEELENRLRQFAHSIEQDVLERVEREVIDLIERNKKGKSKMQSEIYKIMKKYPDKKEKINAYLSERSKNIYTTIKAFQKIIKLIHNEKL